MDFDQLPRTCDIVLIGGGHTHALVLRKWGMAPLAGARLTLINPGLTAAYSGMLPGHIAGHYGRDDLDIDLVRLARFAGARLIVAPAEGIDPGAKTVHVEGRPAVAYDICSIDIGITSDMPKVPGFSEHAVPAKPLGPFAKGWADYLARTEQARIAVIGGGVAGVELAMAMAYCLRTRSLPFRVTVLDSAEALHSLAPRTRDKILTQLANLGIDLREHVEVHSVCADHVALSDGTLIEADFVTGAAGARAYDWLASTGLALRDGFISVQSTLQSSDPSVFAVGDCAQLIDDPRPKAGVYAVRQAPVLYCNLRALAAGGRLRNYRPQKDYLKLISLGQKSALGERFGQAFSGPLIWRWKDRIDQKFMDKFRHLPEMKQPALPLERTTGMDAALGDKPLCGGCGAKVGRTALRQSLGPARDPVRRDIQLLPGDDAAVLLTGQAKQVISSDHLRCMIEDPVTMTRIAAMHALGDIWAMGATPQAATISIILPRLSVPLQERTLQEINATAADALHQAGAEIVGGHTSIGTELTIGFTVTGLCDRDPITLAGGKAGDALLLTKPLGAGVLMAAEMAGKAKGRWIEDALEQMTRSQANAAQILSGANAMTDVTGFGLAGHLMGICEASGVAAVVAIDVIPFLEGAVDMATAGIRSTLFEENRLLAPDLPDGVKIDLLFDPQTAGGLLAAVPDAQADQLLSNLRDSGFDAARIGRLIPGAPHITVEGV